MTQSNQKRNFFLKILFGIGVFISICLFFLLYILLAPNANTNEDNQYLYISKHDQYSDILTQLSENSLIISDLTFNIVATYSNYKHFIRPGRYKLTNGMSNLALIRKLKAGHQDPLKLVINNIRTKEQLAGKLSKWIMADSLSIYNLLNDSSFLSQYNLNTNNVVVLFIPNTYEVFWDMDAEGLFKRMKKEYDIFWNDLRKSKAAAIPMTQIEVMTLASIIEEETNKKYEYPIIAGLYINRLKSKMPLQACPTVKFALNDFTISRILIKHLQTSSPFNTYKHLGLPPGPIRLPSPVCIDAVLSYKKHNYLYMTAKETLNGEHNFASSYSEHSKNARKYQRELNRLKIK